MKIRGLGTDRGRTALMIAAAALVLAAKFLPLWGMTLVSVQYPEGLRMVVYPSEIRGDIPEINVLNHYIGMAEISSDLFVELRAIPALFTAIAVVTLVGALVRRAWAAAVPLALMVGAAGYGFLTMRRRLHQFGHDLDPRAAIEIEPFTPPMLGENVIAQFGTYAYFSWGTLLPMAAGALVAAALWLDLRGSRPSTPTRRGPMKRNRRAPRTVVLALLALAACAGGEAPGAGADVAGAGAPAAPSAGDAEYARLTASWSPGALEGCGRALKETLGTRDLVQGALDGVRDPDGKAAVELEDARHWLASGDARIDGIRPRLEAGACDGDVNVALDEAVQAYVKAGTSAVQAGQIAGS